ncbi:MAG: HAMP domain-containing histidine kinase [Nitrosarchaeum sp.]|nr:HAMP domain-containing histidine kinase [Nitrosarchaeum sp.]
MTRKGRSAEERLLEDMMRESRRFRDRDVRETAYALLSSANELFKFNQSCLFFVDRLALTARPEFALGSTTREEHNGKLESISNGNRRRVDVLDMDQDLNARLKNVVVDLARPSIMQRVVEEGKSYFGTEPYHALTPADHEYNALFRPQDEAPADAFMLWTLKGSHDKVIGVMYANKVFSREPLSCTRADLERTGFDHIRYVAASNLGRYAHMSEMLRRIKHETRNPLTSAGGWIAYVLRHSSESACDPTLVRDALMRARDDVEKTSMYIARIDEITGDIRPQPSVFDMSQMLGGLLGSERMKFGLEYCVDMEGNLDVYADHILSEGVLRNLVRNARMAMEDAKHAGEDPGVLEVRMQDEREVLYLCMKKRPALREAGFREGRMGIGTGIVKEECEKMGVRFERVSEAYGTSVSLWFPRGPA